MPYYITRWVGLIVALAALIVPPTSAQAEETNSTAAPSVWSGWFRQNVSEDEIIPHSVFVTGEHVEIAGEIDGDVWCVGRVVYISGTVTGDVLCAAQEIKVDGAVVGSVRLAAEDVSISGAVVGNATLIGRRLTIGPSAELDGEVHLLGEEAAVAGIVHKDVVGGVERMELAGMIGRDVRMKLDDLAVSPAARVGGGFYYNGPREFSFNREQAHDGVHFIADSYESTKLHHSWWARTWFAHKIVWLLAALLVGAALLVLVPERVRSAEALRREHPFATFLSGIGVLIAAPLLVCLLFITIIGIPLALLLGFAYVGLIFMAMPLAAVSIGHFALLRLQPGKSHTLWHEFAVGMVLFFAVSFIPVVGGLIRFLAVIWTWGVVAWSVAHRPKAAVML